MLCITSHYHFRSKLRIGFPPDLHSFSWSRQHESPRPQALRAALLGSPGDGVGRLWG